MSSSKFTSLNQQPFVYEGYNLDSEEESIYQSFNFERERRRYMLSSLRAFKRRSQSKTLEQWIHERCNSKREFFCLELEDLLKEKSEIFDRLFPLIADGNVNSEGVNNAYKRLKTAQRYPRTRPYVEVSFSKRTRIREEVISTESSEQARLRGSCRSHAFSMRTLRSISGSTVGS